MLYPVVKKTKCQSSYSPNHIAANPKGYVKITNAVENIDKADLQESDHRCKICVGISKTHKKRTH